MDDALANWQWLVPISRRAEAVVLSARSDPDGQFLTHAFGRTRYFDPSSAGEGRGAFESTWAATFAEHSLDCVAEPHAGRVRVDRSDAVAILSMIRRSLRPREGVYVAVEALRGGASGHRLGVLLRTRHESLMRDAGFSGVRSFYLVSGPTLARHLVPIDRPMLLAWDAAMESRGLRSSVRRGIIRMGLHALVFEFRLLVAYA